MTPPDSGEREVRALIEAMAESAHDAWMLAQRREGVTSRKAEWGEEFMVKFSELSERGREFDRVSMRAILAAFDSLGLVVTAKQPNAPVSLPLSLAQRILAALEECGEVVGPGIIFPRHTALADELRAIVERKT